MCPRNRLRPQVCVSCVFWLVACWFEHQESNKRPKTTKDVFLTTSPLSKGAIRSGDLKMSALDTYSFVPWGSAELPLTDPWGFWIGRGAARVYWPRAADHHMRRWGKSEVQEIFWTTKKGDLPGKFEKKVEVVDHELALFEWMGRYHERFGLSSWLCQQHSPGLLGDTEHEPDLPQLWGSHSPRGQNISQNRKNAVWFFCGKKYSNWVIDGNSTWIVDCLFWWKASHHFWPSMPGFSLCLCRLSVKALNHVAWELMIAGLRHLAFCSGLFGELPEDTIEVGSNSEALAPIRINVARRPYSAKKTWWYRYV